MKITSSRPEYGFVQACHAPEMPNALMLESNRICHAMQSIPNNENTLGNEKFTQAPPDPARCQRVGSADNSCGVTMDSNSQIRASVSRSKLLAGSCAVFLFSPISCQTSCPETSALIGVSLSSACVFPFRRRHQQKDSPAISAKNVVAPIVMPAIAPPDMPSSRFGIAVAVAVAVEFAVEFVVVL